MAAAVKKGTVLVPKIQDNQVDYAELEGARVIESTGNIVLVFAQAEVVMPGKWRLHRDLCVGDRIRAFWDADGRFILDWEDEAAEA